MIQHHQPFTAESIETVAKENLRHVRFPTEGDYMEALEEEAKDIRAFLSGQTEDSNHE